jgi:tetratricopeptide (TPR) repeat protein
MRARRIVAKLAAWARRGARAAAGWTTSAAYWAASAWRLTASAATSAGQGIDRTKSLAVSLAIVVAFMVALLIAYKEIGREEELTIEPFAVPKQLTDLGYSGEIAAYRVVEQISNIVKQAKTGRRASLALMQSRTEPAESESVGLTTSNSALALKVPDSDVTIGSIVQSLRHYFSKDGTRVTGSFRCEPAPCKSDGILLRLTVRQGGGYHYIDCGKLPIDSAAATAYYEKAAESILSYLDPYVLGLYLINKNEGEGGLAIMYKLIATNHKDKMWAHNALGLSFYANHDYDSAVFHYKEALAINRNFVPPYINAGNIYKRNAEACKTDPGLAAKYYRLATEAYKIAMAKADRLEQSAYKSTALGNLGRTANERGDVQAAKGFYTEALQTQEPSIDDIISVGNIYYRQHSWIEAAHYYRMATALEPDNYSGNYSLGLVYLVQKDYRNAAQFFGRATQKQADSKTAFEHLASALRNSGDEEAARKAEQQANEIHNVTASPAQPQCERSLAERMGPIGDLSPRAIEASVH